MGCLGLDELHIHGYFLAMIPWHGEKFDYLVEDIVALWTVGTFDDKLGEVSQFVVVQSLGAGAIHVDECSVEHIRTDGVDEGFYNALLEPDDGLAVDVEPVCLLLCIGSSVVLGDGCDVLGGADPLGFGFGFFEYVIGGVRCC